VVIARLAFLAEIDLAAAHASSARAAGALGQSRSGGRHHDPARAPRCAPI